jgi:uncharacterized alkaline shock family protein YloU
MTRQDEASFKMRPGILELIAGIALHGVEGVSGIGIRPDHPEDLKKRRNLSKGIKAELDEEGAVFDLDVVMEYGGDFTQIARNIQKEVMEAVENMTGWEVDAVNVNVVGVSTL